VECEAEPLIYRLEVLAIIGALSDLVVETREIRKRCWRTRMAKKKKMTPRERRAWAEDTPIVRQLRELYVRGMAEVEARRKIDPNYR
jgi:hypothetical protein